MGDIETIAWGTYWFPSRGCLIIGRHFLHMVAPVLLAIHDQQTFYAKELVE
jgi:hypothetical protein